MWHFILTFSTMNSEGCFQPLGPRRHVWEFNDWEDTSGSAWYSRGDCQSRCIPLQRLCQLGVGCGECALTLRERAAVSLDCSSPNSFPQEFFFFSYNVSQIHSTAFSCAPWQETQRLWEAEKGSTLSRLYCSCQCVIVKLHSSESHSWPCDVFMDFL